MSMYSSRKNPYTGTQGTVGHQKFLGGGGLKAKILEAKYAAKLEFPGGRLQNKMPSVGGVWIFPGTGQCAQGNAAELAIDCIPKKKPVILNDSIVFIVCAKPTWSFLLHLKQLQDITCNVSETYESFLKLIDVMQ